LPQGCGAKNSRNGHRLLGRFANKERFFKGLELHDSCFSLEHAVRPEGADHQWRKVPARELSIDLVADERFGWATGQVEAS
jgi:hypothetical protein